MVSGIRSVPISHLKAMNTLRSRLILVFMAATLAPLCLIGWLSVRLLNYSLALAPTEELDQVSRSLEKTGHELYRRAQESLKQDAVSGRVRPQEFPVAARSRLAARDTGVFLERRSRELHRYRQSGRSSRISGPARGRRRDVCRVSQRYLHAAASGSMDGSARDGGRGPYA